MTDYVAIVATEFDPLSVTRLKAALQADGLRCSVFIEDDRRAALREVMDLSPAQYALCVICDTDGRNIGPISTALDPKIPAVCWCPGSWDLSRAKAILTDSPVLVSFADSAELAAQSFRPLLFPNKVSSPPNLDRRPISTLTSPAPVSPDVSPTAPSPVHDEDLAVYEQLETLMSSPLKEVPKQEPVQIQKPALDFSTPLRHLMSNGRSFAHKHSHTEVLGIHYLAALDEPFASELDHAGLTRQAISEYLSGFASGEDLSTEPIISDEAFDAVSKAKARVRASGRGCIRTVDFLQALILQHEGSVADVIHDNALTGEALESALASLEELDEPCGTPFFAPSSLDQESFYQFDPAQVRNVEERLRTLPGFQKAAARVAETRTGQPSFAAPAASSELGHSAPVAAEPPEKPELIKVSADFPSVDAVEHVADRLLEGHLVAFPSDVMFALAADASNPYAIDRLREAAGIPEDKPISILINSTSQLKHLVRADVDALEPLFDEFWPGPLTLVFKALGSVARHVSAGGSIAVRQPADNTSLAILSMLGRPLAITSWNEVKPGQPVDTQRLSDHLSGLASIIVSHGEPVPQLRTTVVDMTTTPWTILREGAVPGQSVLRFMQ